MLRPGLHFGNTSAVTDADLDIIRRWSPLSLLLAMNNIVEDTEQIKRLKRAWDLAGQPELVLRRYFHPNQSNYNGWGKHAHESLAMAERCINAALPVGKLILKPFCEPNMPEGGAQWEGFGQKPEAISKYNDALNRFIDIVHEQMPGLRIGGPHLTIGNRDCRFSNDPQAEYYYHGLDGQFESSNCAEALSRLDCHFVHCYSFHEGDWNNLAYGLRFLEYEKYLKNKPIYIVEGAYCVNCGEPTTNEARGRDTAAYLKLLGEKYPQVKGISLWIGGNTGWFAFRHSDGANPESHRPVVFWVEDACKEEPTPPPPPPEPPDDDTIEFVGLSEEMIEALEIIPAWDSGEAYYWKVTRIEVQPETNHQSAFAIFLPSERDPVCATFRWDNDFHDATFKSDPLAPVGAKERAASMPMFAAWGSYSVEILDGYESEAVKGFGLYGDNLELDYTAHHPVLVYFKLVEQEEPPEPPEPPERARGIDVSQYQKEIDWRAVADDGVEFAYIRASAGLTEDLYYQDNQEGAEAVGILRGAYHYLRHDFSATMQAEDFAAIIGRDELELPPMVDVEDNGGKNPLTQAQVQTFIEAFNGFSGKQCAVYTSYWMWDEAFGFDGNCGAEILWVADWRDKPEPVLPAAWKSWDFWQYTVGDEGTVPGISTRIDLDWFNGTAEELRAKYPKPGPPPVDPLDVIMPLAKEKLNIVHLPEDFAFPAKAIEVGFPIQAGGVGGEVLINGEVWSYQTHAKAVIVCYCKRGDWQNVQWTEIIRD